MTKSKSNENKKADIKFVWYNDYDLCVYVDGRILKVFDRNVVLLVPAIEYWEDDEFDDDPLYDVPYRLMYLDEISGGVYESIIHTGLYIDDWMALFQELSQRNDIRKLLKEWCGNEDS